VLQLICLECGIPVKPSKGQWRNNIRCYPCARAREAALLKIVGIVQRARKRGTLVKSNCEVCGSEKSEAHHDDYSQPLVVRWLCRRHHKIHHSQFGPGLNAPVAALA
jgi:hypothetical protein